MTTAEILREARALYAANPSHVGGPDCPDEGSYCPILAIQAADPFGLQVAYIVFCEAAENPISVVDWNAEHTTDEVLAAFDRAIEAAA